LCYNFNTINHKLKDNVLPQTINYGEEAKIHITMISWQESTSILIDYKKLIARTLKLIVCTSTDEIVKVRIARNLKQSLIEFITPKAK
jgi:hypothetical protein